MKTARILYFRVKSRPLSTHTEKPVYKVTAGTPDVVNKSSHPPASSFPEAWRPFLVPSVAEFKHS